jgi:hypothetical protein
MPSMRPMARHIVMSLPPSEMEFLPPTAPLTVENSAQSFLLTPMH